MPKGQNEPNRKKKNSRNHRLKKRIAIAAAAAVVLGGIAWAKFSGNNRTAETEGLYTVKRGDLRISVLESGKIQARKSVSLSSQVDGQSTIITIVPEGTYVKEGDVLVELDSSDLRDRMEQQQITCESAEAALTNAKEAKEIQQNQNESNVKAAQLALDFAKIDLEKYVEGDWEQQKTDAANKIVQAETSLEIAKLRLDGTEALYSKGYVPISQLKADRSSHQSAQIALDQAKRAKELLEQYDHPKQLAKFTADYEEAQKELERAKRRASSELAQKEADLKAKEAMYNMQKERLDKFQDQLDKTVMKAPQPGLVIYASSTEGGRPFRSDRGLIAEGEKVWERQRIIDLPDLSNLKVEVSVHESVRDMIKADQETIISVEALPGLTLHGHVEKVAILPDSGRSWMNPDLTVYPTTVIIDDKAEALKPGMTAKVEIIIADLDNVLYVPVQSVTVRQEQEVCYVMGKDGKLVPTEVEVGLSNDTYIEIKSGLKEKDRVLTYAPIASGEAASRGEPSAPEDEQEKAPGVEKAPEIPEATETAPPGTGPETPGQMQQTPEERAKALLQNLTPEQKKAMQERLQKMGITETIDPENMTPEKMREIRRKFMEQAGEAGQGPESPGMPPRRRGPRPERGTSPSSPGQPGGGRTAPPSNQ